MSTYTDSIRQPVYLSRNETIYPERREPITIREWRTADEANTFKSARVFVGGNLVSSPTTEIGLQRVISRLSKIPA